ncbi:hypothetical protein [Streptomyces sp. NPDC087538]|uniref:hypothetical protein n=1 Tax=Streptomyces sp. NPDC087538 TaxID=3365797 RepID=UPI0038254707
MAASIETDAVCFHCKTPLGVDGVTLRENPLATDVWGEDPEDAMEPMCDTYEQDLYDHV